MSKKEFESEVPHKPDVGGSGARPKTPQEVSPGECLGGRKFRGRGGGAMPWDYNILARIMTPQTTVLANRASSLLL